MKEKVTYSASEKWVGNDVIYSASEKDEDLDWAYKILGWKKDGGKQRKRHSK